MWATLPWSTFHAFALRNVRSMIEHNVADIASLREISACSGISEAQLRRWSQRGEIPLLAADHAAIKLGVHPSVIWGDAWWEMADRSIEHEAAVLERRRQRNRKKSTTS